MANYYNTKSTKEFHRSGIVNRYHWRSSYTNPPGYFGTWANLEQLSPNSDLDLRSFWFWIEAPSWALSGCFCQTAPEFFFDISGSSVEAVCYFVNKSFSQIFKRIFFSTVLHIVGRHDIHNIQQFHPLFNTLFKPVLSVQEVSRINKSFLWKHSRQTLMLWESYQNGRPAAKEVTNRQKT